MIQVSKMQIDAAIPLVKDGLAKYIWLQDNFKTTNVLEDREYRRRFNHFYKVRRNEEWQAVFYKLLDSAKHNNINYADILTQLQRETNRLEASFASKLVATVSTDSPVIDQFVLQNFGLKLPPQTASDRLKKTINVYHQLEKAMQQLIASDIGYYLITCFKDEYSKHEISDVKMVDLVLWQIR